MEKPIRQGDILLTQVTDLDELARIRKMLRGGEAESRKRGEDVIVAAGEVTGHHHRIKTSGTRMIRRGSFMYVSVPKKGAELSHEEHETLAIPPGIHKVTNQREYVPAAAPQRVYD